MTKQKQILSFTLLQLENAYAELCQYPDFHFKMDSIEQLMSSAAFAYPETI